MTPFTVGIVIFPGSNCDRDVSWALEACLDIKTKFLWHESSDLTGIDSIVLPGGFSYGDYLRCGAVARFSSLINALDDFVKTGRKVTFWYGGRSKRELFYLDHFKALENDFSNFKFYVALSEPMEEDNWKVKEGLDGDGDGFKGFVHQCVIDNYLNHHEAPEDIEVYFCGPPLMNQAVEKMADDFGIPPENVRFDDFGG